MCRLIEPLLGQLEPEQRHVPVDPRALSPVRIN
jgi:hypothetical protein